MLLLAEWAKRNNEPLPVVLTVDHGLQKNSAKDARMVLERARAAGLKAWCLRWKGAKPRSDIEAAARDARYALMAAWCRKNGIGAIYLAHTLEDQAETFLLRLARGSGIDGLSAMRIVAPLPLAEASGIVAVRPLLGVRRRALRTFLEQRGEAWVEDPMNANPRFARVRIRAAWPQFEQAGLSPERIASAAEHLARARSALDAETDRLLAACSRIEDETVLLDSARIAAAPREIGLRALATTLMKVSGQVYRPRFDRLERLYSHVCDRGVEGGKTLHGCRIAPARKKNAVFGPETLVVSREKNDRRKTHRSHKFRENAR
jgi:tRNA(Ile)-lysidine synthase